MGHAKSKNSSFSGIGPVKEFPANLMNTSKITPLVRSYAGFGKAGKSNLFCWFFESQKCVDPKEAGDFPLLIWLNGGPGASSMAGLLLENGPYLQQSDPAGTIVENPYAWNREAHVMYWDNPVGSGYSYNHHDGHYHYVDSERELSKQFYEALQSFFDDYPVYRKCPLFVTGESYGGKYIPAITSRIVQENAKGDKPLINIKGMAIGNPWMDPVMQTKFRLEMGFELGFLDTKQHKHLMRQYKRLPQYVNDGEWEKAFHLNQKLKNELIACGGNVAIYDVRTWDDGLIGSMLGNYFNMKEVKKALNVPEDTRWQIHDETGPVTDHLVQDFMTNTVYQSDKKFDFSLPYLLDEATDKSGKKPLRVLLYTGNLDMSCGVRGTEYILYNLKWSHEGDWRKLRRKVWAEPRGTTKGFIKSCSNLTQIVIPCSGHLVPVSQPAVSLEMVNNFVFKREFPSYDPLSHKEL